MIMWPEPTFKTHQTKSTVVCFFVLKWSKRGRGGGFQPSGRGKLELSDSLASAKSQIELAGYWDGIHIHSDDSSLKDDVSLFLFPCPFLAGATYCWGGGSQGHGRKWDCGGGETLPNPSPLLFHEDNQKNWDRFSQLEKMRTSILIYWCMLLRIHPTLTKYCCFWYPIHILPLIFLCRPVYADEGVAKCCLLLSPFHLFQLFKQKWWQIRILDHGSSSSVKYMT